MRHGSTNDSEPNLKRMRWGLNKYSEAWTNAVLQRYQGEEQDKVMRPQLYTRAKS